METEGNHRFQRKLKFADMLSKVWLYAVIFAVGFIALFAFTIESREWNKRSTDATTEELARLLNTEPSEIPSPADIKQDEEADPTTGSEPMEFGVYDVYYEIDDKRYHMVYWHEISYTEDRTHTYWAGIEHK